MSDVEFIRRLVSAWECCGTCAGGVLVARDRERDAPTIDRLAAAEDEVALLHKVRDMEWDADAPMPESNIPEWGTEDYRRHATLFNDITHAPLQARLLFSDRLRMQRTLWALGWRRDVRPEDVTEKPRHARATAPQAPSEAQDDPECHEKPADDGSKP